LAIHEFEGVNVAADKEDRFRFEISHATLAIPYIFDPHPVAPRSAHEIVESVSSRRASGAWLFRVAVRFLRADWRLFSASADRFNRVKTFAGAMIEIRHSGFAEFFDLITWQIEMLSHVTPLDLD
jgi:hypothetical protein